MNFHKECCVSAAMCDMHSKLGLIRLLELIEDVCTEYLKSLSLDGLTTKRKYGAVWVYVRNNVRIFRLPDWLEKFEATSYISKKTRATIEIETVFTDGNGLLLACSRIELCAIDLKTGRIRRVSDVGVTDGIETHPPRDGLDFSNIPAAGGEPVYSTQVRASNLDYIGHANNVEYLRFMIDSYPAEFFFSHFVERIQINYVSQSFENDRLDIYRKSDGGIDAAAIRKGDKDVLKCLIEWG